MGLVPLLWSYTNQRKKNFLCSFSSMKKKKKILILLQITYLLFIDKFNLYNLLDFFHLLVHLPIQAVPSILDPTDNFSWNPACAWIFQEKYINLEKKCRLVINYASTSLFPDSTSFSAAECGFTEPSAEWCSCSWWAWTVHIRTRNTMLNDRNSIDPHTILTYFFNGLQWFVRISENAALTDWHSTRLSMPGYAFNRFWIELV